MRELPTLEIEGTTFVVDVERNVLFEKAKPQNELYLFDMFVYDSGYEFTYDRKEKCIVRITDPSKYKSEVKLEPMTVLDAEGMATKYGKPLSEVVGRTDFEVMVDRDVLLWRVNGNLPTLSILGETYIVDVGERVFAHHSGNPDAGISFDDLAKYFRPEEMRYVVPFDLDTKRPVPGNLEADNVVAVVIPAVFTLDPLGICWERDNYIRRRLMECPPGKHFHAEVNAWESRGLPKHVIEKIKGLRLESEQFVKGLPDKTLPERDIEGNAFLVDVNRNVLVEKANPLNEISVFTMELLENGYGFYFDTVRKNAGYGNRDDGTEVYVEIPWLTELDPERMALKYGKELREVAGKTDYEVMVDQRVLDLRINKGKLPTVDIAGHIFYPYIREERLQPRDDFSTMGIRYDDIEGYSYTNEKAYLIPYDPVRHEFREPDYEKLLDYPKDLIAVELPPIHVLDPAGFAKHHDLTGRDFLMENPPREHFRARVIPWEETVLSQLIRYNRAKKAKSERQEQKAKKGRSRGL